MTTFHVGAPVAPAELCRPPSQKAVSDDVPAGVA
jgi:hypothetical protein